MGMDLNQYINGDHLHHAYVIEAPRIEGVAGVRELLRGLGVSIHANPDFHQYEYDALLIEHAHLLRGEQSFRAADGAKKIFLITFNTIMSEAQNALLKTLEEPTEHTHFFFVTRSAEILFPTVRSRMQIIQPFVNMKKDPAGETPGDRFLAGDLTERMKMIEPLTKAKTEEKPKAKEDARVLLESLERSLYPRLPDEVHIALPLRDILAARRAMTERAPSIKILLEHIALTFPQFE